MKKNLRSKISSQAAFNSTEYVLLKKEANYMGSWRIGDQYLDTQWLDSNFCTSKANDKVRGEAHNKRHTSATDSKQHLKKI